MVQNGSKEGEHQSTVATVKTDVTTDAKTTTLQPTKTQRTTGGAAPSTKTGTINHSSNNHSQETALPGPSKPKEAPAPLPGAIVVGNGGRTGSSVSNRRSRGGENVEHGDSHTTTSIGDDDAVNAVDDEDYNLVDSHCNRGSGEDGEESPTNDPGKMFIGGLSWQTSAEGLRDYFSRFGDVNECMVMRDPATKRARGFGFITFADPSSVEKVLIEENHELDGKKIDPKIAFPRRPQPKMVVKTKKVFIGGLSSSSTLEDMKAYFGNFGKIEDAMLMYDKATQRHRGFGFITFDDDEVSDKVCEIHFHEINGKMVECKKAQPKEVMLPVQLNKSRAAAARNLYGLAPEQLLAYASYMPRFPPSPYASPTLPAAIYPAGIFNGGFGGQSFGISPPGRSTVSNNNNNGAGPMGGSGGGGLLNPLAAVQLAAQQQAVYDATLAFMGGGPDFPRFSTDFQGAPLHHHHLTPQQQQHPHMSSPQQHSFHHQHVHTHPQQLSAQLMHQSTPSHQQMAATAANMGSNGGNAAANFSKI